LARTVRAQPELHRIDKAPVGDSSAGLLDDACEEHDFHGDDSVEYACASGDELVEVGEIAAGYRDDQVLAPGRGGDEPDFW
jgi:hypothetical protein